MTSESCQGVCAGRRAHAAARRLECAKAKADGRTVRDVKLFEGVTQAEQTFWVIDWVTLTRVILVRVTEPSAVLHNLRLANP